MISGSRYARVVRRPILLALEGAEQESKKAEARKLAEDARRALMEAEAAERKVKDLPMNFSLPATTFKRLTLALSGSNVTVCRAARNCDAKKSRNKVRFR